MVYRGQESPLPFSCSVSDTLAQPLTCLQSAFPHLALTLQERIQKFKASLAVEGSDLNQFAREAEAQGAAAAGIEVFGGAAEGGGGGMAGGGSGDRPVCCICIVPDTSGYGRTGQGQHKNAHKGEDTSSTLVFASHPVESARLAPCPPLPASITPTQITLRVWRLSLRFRA